MRTPWARKDWYRSFQDLPREHGFEPLQVEGKIPASLRGTFWRAGPGAFSAEGMLYRHWFDCDGAVAAVRLEGGAAQGAARMVETKGLLAERAAGKPLLASFGTPGPTLRSRIGARVKNTANTSVMLWQDRLFALAEGGLPYEIGAKDLATAGETNLDGAVPAMFSAHPRRVPARRAAYNFGMVPGRKSALALFELPDSGAARRLGLLPLAKATAIHDFIATERRLVFLVHPLELNAFRLFFGLATVAEALEWKPESGTEVIVAPIEDVTKAVRYKTDAFHHWHCLNAFERGDEIVADLVAYPDFASLGFGYDAMAGKGLGGAVAEFGRLERVVLNPARETVSRSPLWSTPCEFPRVSPRVDAAKHRYGYFVAASGRSDFPDAVAKLDLETGGARLADAGEGRWLGEGVFAPRPEGRAEDDGWILSMAYDAREHRSGLAVFDARAPEGGAVATAWFDHHVPLGFHGAWAPA